MKRVYADVSPIFARMERADFDRPEWQNICIEAHEQSLNDQIVELQAIEKLERGRIQVLPHQIDAVMTAINKMGTRAILADEVGLGKTIEAGIILKEYLSRRLVSRVLILCPASLTTQWRGELQEKFGERFSIADSEDDPDFQGWEQHPLLIASIDTAKKASHAERILQIPWDMVVIDEAHRLKNDQTVGYRFVRQLKSRFMLMLTATPIQNSLFELYNLVNLLQEGLLGTPDFFRDRFVADKQGRVLKESGALSQRLRRVMIRHRRAEVGLHFVDRHVESLLLDGSRAEVRLHEAVIDFVRRAYRGNDPLTFIRLSRMLASSPQALRSSIEKTLEHAADPVVRQGLVRLSELAQEAAEGEISKLSALRTILTPLAQEKAIVFTGFYETQKYLAVRLSAMGYKVVLFSGRMNQREKDAAVEEFRRDGQILLATDAGSEGVNLQFAHVLVNYDLPWNPMRVEQRIGRVHRLGQTHDVLIFNLAIRDTIEEYLLGILETKIRLFSHAVGETDLILSSLRGPESIEKAILEIIAQSGSSEKLEDGFRLLGDQLEMARQAAAHIREFDEKTLSLLDLSAIEGVSQ